MTTIQDIFDTKEFPQRKEYSDLFELILSAKDQYEGEALSEQLAMIIESYKVNSLKIKDFPQAEKNQYSRSYIGRDYSGWESIICRWEEGANSSIHGHPDFVFYYVLEGKIEMPFYKKSKEGELILDRIQILEKGEFVFSVGPEGKFENMIHAIKALEPSLSLHVFSDNALKGEVYEV